MMYSYFKRSLYIVSAVLLLVVGLPSLAVAGAKIKIDDTKYFQIGMGFRGSLALNHDAAPNGKDDSFDPKMENMRLYTVSQVHKNIQVEYNTEFTGENVTLLDAVAKFKFDSFELWLGRQLPPSDRFNLDGPYYLNAAWSFPMVQSFGNLGSGCCGRDDGVAVHGDINGGKFKWAYGVFEGTEGGSDQEDRVKHTARLDFALSDPEPGFYTGSTYFGAKKLTTIGFVFQHENDGTGTATDKGDFTGWSVDGLVERSLGNGAVVNLEGAFFNWDTDGKKSHTGTNITNLLQGESYLLLASYLMPKKTSIGGIQGKLQPYFRYQGYNRSFHNATGNQGFKSRIETGINYVIDGFNAKITGLWYQDEDVDTNGTFMLATQFQL